VIHDPDLLTKLSLLKNHRFDGFVYRATSLNADPLASSISGGRWSLSPDNHPGNYVLYTSLEKNGAIAEVVSFLMNLNPLPGPRKIKISKIQVSTGKTVQLDHSSLRELGVDLSRYGERDYLITQRIGAALVFLGVDGLIAPSARWTCDNLVIFSDNHKISEDLKVVESEEVEWLGWAKAQGLL
jgi:hypothetical protein